MTDPVLLYDGFCVLCSRSVQWLIRRDRKGIFQFVPLQSDEGKIILKDITEPEIRSRIDSITDQAPETVVLVLNGRAYIESDAALLAMAQLGGMYRMATWLRILPRAIRDSVYRFIARNRFAWFGQRDQCYLPPRPTVHEKRPES